MQRGFVADLLAVLVKILLFFTACTPLCLWGMCSIPVWSMSSLAGGPWMGWSHKDQQFAVPPGCLLFALGSCFLSPCSWCVGRGREVGSTLLCTVHASENSKFPKMPVWGKEAQAPGSLLYPSVNKGLDLGKLPEVLVQGAFPSSLLCLAF